MICDPLPTYSESFMAIAYLLTRKKT